MKTFPRDVFTFLHESKLQLGLGREWSLRMSFWEENDLSPGHGSLAYGDVHAQSTRGLWACANIAAPPRGSRVLPGSARELPGRLLQGSSPDMERTCDTGHIIHFNHQEEGTNIPILQMRKSRLSVHYLFAWNHKIGNWCKAYSNFTLPHSTFRALNFFAIVLPQWCAAVKSDSLQ